MNNMSISKNTDVFIMDEITSLFKNTNQLVGMLKSLDGLHSVKIDFDNDNKLFIGTARWLSESYLGDYTEPFLKGLKCLKEKIKILTKPLPELGYSEPIELQNTIETIENLIPVLLNFDCSSYAKKDQELVKKKVIAVTKALMEALVKFNKEVKKQLCPTDLPPECPIFKIEQVCHEEKSESISQNTSLITDIALNNLEKLPLDLESCNESAGLEGKLEIPLKQNFDLKKIIVTSDSYKFPISAAEAKMIEKESESGSYFELINIVKDYENKLESFEENYKSYYAALEKENALLSKVQELDPSNGQSSTTRGGRGRGGMRGGRGGQALPSHLQLDSIKESKIQKINSKNNLMTLLFKNPEKIEVSDFTNILEICRSIYISELKLKIEVYYQQAMALKIVKNPTKETILSAEEILEKKVETLTKKVKLHEEKIATKGRSKTRLENDLTRTEKSLVLKTKEAFNEKDEEKTLKLYKEAEALELKKNKIIDDLKTNNEETIKDRNALEATKKELNAVSNK